MKNRRITVSFFFPFPSFFLFSRINPLGPPVRNKPRQTLAKIHPQNSQPPPSFSLPPPPPLALSSPADGARALAVSLGSKIFSRSCVRRRPIPIFSATPPVRALEITNRRAVRSHGAILHTAAFPSAVHHKPHTTTRRTHSPQLPSLSGDPPSPTTRTLGPMSLSGDPLCTSWLLELENREEATCKQ